MARTTPDVIAEQTQLAEYEAAVALESEIRRPPEPKPNASCTLAEADRDRTKLFTEAEAYTQRSLAAAARDTTKLNADDRLVAHGLSINETLRTSIAHES